MSSTTSKVHHKKKKRTFESFLDLKPPDGDELMEVLKAYDVSTRQKRNREVQDERMVAYRASFPTWSLRLENSFNLLFYGFGSKRALLEELVTYATTTEAVRTSRPARQTASRNDNGLYTVVRIEGNGSSPSSSAFDLKDCLARSMMGEWLNLPPKRAAELRRKSPLEQCHAISTIGSSATSSSRRRLLLVIHSIDGCALRGKDVQTALGVLARCPRVHLAATSDHANGVFLWDRRDLDRFNWCWIHTPTFNHFERETGGGYRTSLTAARSKTAATTQGVAYVLRSLTPNHVTVLKEMAKRQLAWSEEHGEEEEDGEKGAVEGFPGVEYRELLDFCLSHMLVSGDGALKHYLNEFLDHALLAYRKDNKLILNMTEEQIREEVVGFVVSG